MNVLLKCNCGALRGIAKNMSSVQGHRVICMCDDCQAYAHFLGRAKSVLDENGGTDVLPVAPSNLEITQGIENLKCLRLTGKGMLRWYAGCCNTPIANTAPFSKVPFAGVVHTIMDFAGNAKARDNSLGPVGMRVQCQYGIGNLAEGTYQKTPLKLILHTVRFLIAGWLKGQYAPSPFFNLKTGKPTVGPYILTAIERESLRKFCGPKPSET